MTLNAQDVAAKIDALVTEPNRWATPCGNCRVVVEPGTGLLYPGPPPRVYCLPHAPEGAVADLRAGKLLKAGHELRAYQRAGVRWLAGRRKGLLADQPGLGKTIQAVAALREQPAVIVVGPKAAKGAWAEHATWRDDIRPVLVDSARRSFRWPVPGEMLIFNYEQLPEEFPAPPDWAVSLIVDEAHFCKSPSAKRTRLVRALVARISPHPDASWWLLTGTPQKKDPDDLWSVLCTGELHHETWGTAGAFNRSFGGRRGRFGMQWSLNPPDAAIPDILRRVMLRRLKSDVLRELPPKIWEKVIVQIDQQAVRAADKAISALRSVGVDLETVTYDALLTKITGPAFQEVSAARAALAAAKVPALLELVEQHEDAYPTDPLLVWCFHKAPLLALLQDRKEAGSAWEGILGQEHDPKGKKIQDRAARFQAGELRGLGITYSKGGTSLTLTRADRAIHVDLCWTPPDNEQAEDRIHRFGQTRPVTYTRLIADHALDRRLFELLSQREAVAAATIDRAWTLSEEYAA